MKNFLLTVMFLMLLSVTAMAQWEYAGPWPDASYKGGSHGVVVDPDGKIWQASYYRSNWTTPTGDVILCTPIYVFNPDGSLLDSIGIVTTGGVVDTLGNSTATSGTRGLAKDESGNILWCASGPGRIIKIDYQTRQGIARHDFQAGEIGSSPTKPGVTSDGTIFVGPVVGNGSPDAKIAMFATDLTYQGEAVVGPPAIARTMEVSSDGLAIYWTVFTGDHQGMYIYTRPSEFDPFVLADSVLEGMSIESVAWHPVTGNLWVSNDARGTGGYSHLTWYEFDITTKTLVDSFTLVDPDTTLSDDLSRAIAFSNDGATAYVGVFGTGYDRIYRFDNTTSVDDQGQVVVNGYKLSQNYPNPFNPSTKITFELPASGYVSLKVYDMLGREVAELASGEMTSGTHSVSFNASDLASGTYIYRLTANGNVLTNKMLLLK